MDYHIIGDIHGQGDKLERLLQRLGYVRKEGVYQQPGAKVVFLGDFIDRGPQHRQVLNIVRSMVEASHALAVMGNHEFNAIAYHTPHPETGEPLRPHTEKNTGQHQAFLDEYRLHEEETHEIIGWFKTLPLYLEVKDDEGRVLFRAVHACWSRPVIERVPQYLDTDYLVSACDKTQPAYDDIEVILKGPEIDLPQGYSFHDKSGIERHNIRIKWWNDKSPVTYQEIAMVPEGEAVKLPDEPVPKSQIGNYTYDRNEPPVFFGHYWLTGKPASIANNLACLDYSAGMGGQLVAYHWREGESVALSADCFVSM